MFVKGGDVNPGNGLRYAGDSGLYWSSVGDNSNYACRLYFTSGYVAAPSARSTRYFGLSVRCVALGG